MESGAFIVLLQKREQKGGKMSEKESDRNREQAAAAVTPDRSPEDLFHTRHGRGFFISFSVCARFLSTMNGGMQ
jgi:hypothetical protein